MEFTIQAGGKIDLLTKSELDDSLAAQRQPYQALSWFRLPVLNGQASGSVLSMGGDSSPEHTPTQGYIWSLRHLVITGMTRGATPDIVQIFRGQLVIWELNGNQYAQTWGKGQIMVNEGETLAYKSVGTFAATGNIQIHGTAWQAPAQMAAELAS